ncbi:MAG: methylated-DNA--[protein]-cysteine S-methyltransferase [Gammaproteobacteria bacterium]|nr:MAG: methylated-DNA--[protein]-cysteine S-methyltransferase [Gammaproteobacteria bacterium]
MSSWKRDYQAIIETPVGYVGVISEGARLTRLEFLSQRFRPKESDDPFIIDVCRQIHNYMSEPGYRFDIPVKLCGTPYQQAVCRALSRIKPGKTISYGDLADKLGSSARAVGGACKNNPLPIIIPCHRVVSRRGLGGFSGKTSGVKLDIKRWLLSHEASAGSK